MTEIRRLKYIDMLKGFGIIVMIFGHCDFPAPFQHYIHAFHMPVFYFTAGYFYKANKEKLSKKIKKKAYSLLIPYFSFLMIYFFFYFILLDVTTFDFIQRVKNTIIFQTAINYPIPIGGALWFLISLFMLYVIEDTLNTVFSRKVCLLISLLLFIIGCFSWKLPFILPLCLSQAFVGSGLFYIAFYFKEKINYILSYFCGHLLILLGIGVVFSISTLLSDTVNMRGNWYGLIPIPFIINCIGLTMFWAALMKKWAQINLLNIIKNALENIGINSITYLGLNQLFCYLLKTNVKNYFLKGLLVIALCYLVDIAIHKCKLQFLLGKR